MKVLYDHQIFSSQVYGGISRYFCELMRCFARNHDVKFNLAITYSNNSYLPDAGIANARPFFKEKKFLGKTSWMNLVNRATSIRSLHKGQYDLFHPTYYQPYFLNHIGTKPYVVTVYDMVHELYPEMFPAGDDTREWKRNTILKAAAIIAISQTTKDDLVRLYGMDADRVKVIGLANSLRPDSLAASVPPLPERYLLFVGHRGGYKNFPFFIGALASLLRSDHELEVVCAGGGTFSPEETQLLHELGVAGRVKQFSVHDETLPALYRRALAFVFPSLYEGFGIPILEAFACGCPVLASDRSSLPEIAGDAAGLFDPTDQGSLRVAVEKAVYDGDYRANLIARGEKRERAFSWEKTASQTRLVYEGAS